MLFEKEVKLLKGSKFLKEVLKNSTLSSAELHAEVFLTAGVSPKFAVQNSIFMVKEQLQVFLCLLLYPKRSSVFFKRINL
jgi:hypothetical protein